MRLSDIKENDQQLDELLPAVGTALGAGARAVGGMAANAAKQAAGAIAQQGSETDPTTVQKVDPMLAAKMAKDQMEKKKQIQDQIKQKQKELQDLQKQLTQL